MDRYPFIKRRVLIGIRLNSLTFDWTPMNPQHPLQKDVASDALMRKALPKRKQSETRRWKRKAAPDRLSLDALACKSGAASSLQSGVGGRLIKSRFRCCGSQLRLYLPSV